MATIRPKDLPAAGSVTSSHSLVVDNGSTVEKATPTQVVDAAIPLATQAEAEAGSDNTKRVTPLRVKQAIDANVPSNDTLASVSGADKLVDVSTTSTDNEPALRAGLDAWKKATLTTAGGRYPIGLPLVLESDEAVDGGLAALYNNNSSTGAPVASTITFGQAHAIFLHGDHAGSPTQPGLNWYQVSSISGAVLTFADAATAAHWADGNGMLLRVKDEFVSDVSGSLILRRYPRLHACRVVKNGVSGATVTVDLPPPYDWNTATLEAANTDQGYAGDNGKTFQIGFRQSVRNISLQSLNGNPTTRGGLIEGIVENVTGSGSAAWAINLMQRSVMVGGRFTGTSKALEAALNSRDSTFVGTYFGLKDGGTYFSWGAAFDEYAESIRMVGVTLDLGGYNVGGGTGFLFSTGTKRSGFMGSKIEARNCAASAIEFRADAADPATTTQDATESNFFIGNAVRGGASLTRHIHCNLTAGGYLRRNRAAFNDLRGTVSSNALDVDGDQNIFAFNIHETGSALINSTATKCALIGNYYPSGWAGAVDVTRRAANLVALNASDASVRNNIASAASETYQTTVPANTYTSGSPLVLASATYAAGDLAKYDVISLLCFGQASTAATENRVVTMQMSIDAGGSWIDIASVTTTASGQDWSLEGEAHIESSTTISTRIMQGNATATTPNCIRTTGATLAGGGNGLRFRIIAYTAGAVATNTIMRTMIRAKTPGMLSLND